MSVVEQLDSVSRLGCREQFRNIETGFTGDVPQSLQRLETVPREGSDGSLVVQQVPDVEVQHGQHAGLDYDDLSAAVKVGPQHVGHGTGLRSCSFDHS